MNWIDKQNDFSYILTHRTGLLRKHRHWRAESRQHRWSRRCLWRRPASLNLCDNESYWTGQPSCVSVYISAMTSRTCVRPISWRHNINNIVKLSGISGVILEYYTSVLWMDHHTCFNGQLTIKWKIIFPYDSRKWYINLVSCWISRSNWRGNAHDTTFV